MDLVVETTTKKDIVDITDKIRNFAEQSTSGIIVLNVLHTTAALTTADLDPDTDQDLLDFLDGITADVQWRHPHDPAHAPAHLLSSVIGPSLTVPIRGGQLQLGTWQRIILVELDGPRQRRLGVSVFGG